MERKIEFIQYIDRFKILNNDSGISNAGIFHIICKPCDGSVFQDYEKAEAYETYPTEKALNQIALKNALRDIYKHETEIEMFEASKQIMKEKNRILSLFVNPMFNAQIRAKSVMFKNVMISIIFLNLFDNF